MGHGSSDAVLDLLKVTSTGLEYRLGVNLRPATEPLPESDPTYTLRVQIAAPPPFRRDGSAWYAGLLVEDGTDDGHPFDPEDPSWMESAVSALKGISPLDTPDAATLIFNQDVTVERVTDTARASFTLIASDERADDGVNHFVSLFYPLLRDARTGEEVRDAGVTFYRKDEFLFDRPISGFAALSLKDEFQPPDRSSVEYIFYVPGP